MNENIDNLSLFSQIKPINQDITVIYTPNTDVVSYNYTLYKDNKIIELEDFAKSAKFGYSDIAYFNIYSLAI